MNTKIYSPLLLVLALLLGTSCQRAECIQAELGTPKYTITDSADPLDHLIYQIKEETGLQLVYNFQPEDALWNLGVAQTALHTYRYVPFNNPQERAALLEHLTKFKAEFLDLYPTELKRNYFPLRVYLCDSIINRKKDRPTGMGRDHIALNILSSKDANPSGTYHTQQWIALHKSLWQYIFTYRLEVPPTFASFAAGNYGKGGPEITKPTNLDPREFGFWAWDTTNYCGRYNCLVDLEEDVAQYILRMVSLPEAEMITAMGGYEIMETKYNILRQYIKDKTGVDLQEIGNSQS